MTGTRGHVFFTGCALGGLCGWLFDGLCVLIVGNVTLPLLGCCFSYLFLAVNIAEIKVILVFVAVFLVLVVVVVFLFFLVVVVVFLFFLVVVVFLIDFFLLLLVLTGRVHSVQQVCENAS